MIALNLFFSPTVTLDHIKSESNILDSNMSNVSFERFHTLTGKIRSLNTKNLAKNPEDAQKAWLYKILDLIISLLVAGSIASVTLCPYHPQTCPARYDEFLPFRGQCYRFSEDNLTWLEAQSICKEDGGALLEIYTESELGYVQDVLKFKAGIDHIWLGASDHRNRKAYLWNQTEKGLAYSIPWAENFRATGPSVTCLLLLGAGKNHWISTVCDSKSSYICKVNMGPKKHGGLEDVSRYATTNSNQSIISLKPWATETFTGGSNFTFIKSGKSLNWEDARSLCQSRGMDLVYIDTIEKYFFIFIQISIKISAKARFWLGGFREESASSQFEITWVNGQRKNWSQNFWQITEDDNWSKKCVANHFFAPGRDELAVLVRKKSVYHVFYLVDCDETYLFRDVVCEAPSLKRGCSSTNDCHQLATCVNGRCLCNAGYDGDGARCFDVDECRQVHSSDLTNCWRKHHDRPRNDEVKVECRNTAGSYNCSNLDHHAFDSKRRDTTEHWQSGFEPYLGFNSMVCRNFLTYGADFVNPINKTKVTDINHNQWESCKKRCIWAVQKNLPIS